MSIHLAYGKVVWLYIEKRSKRKKNLVYIFIYIFILEQILDKFRHSIFYFLNLV
jgi:hypothetical protein